MSNINNTTKNTNHTKYKISLCKHYNTQKGCRYGEKCQFAHGNLDLRPNISQYSPMIQNQNDFLNYKVVKCKNWDKNKTCKYGMYCSFAHGNNELRTKKDNLTQILAFPMLNNPGMMIPVKKDFNGLNSMIQGNNQNQLIMKNISQNGNNIKNIQK